MNSPLQNDLTRPRFPHILARVRLGETSSYPSPCESCVSLTGVDEPWLSHSIPVKSANRECAVYIVRTCGYTSIKAQHPCLQYKIPSMYLASRTHQMDSTATAWRTPMSSKNQTSLDAIPMREPRDEQLMIPRSSKRKPTPFMVAIVPTDSTRARVSRPDSPEILPGSPKVIEYQSGAGASRRRGVNGPCSNYEAHKQRSEVVADQSSEFSLSILDYYLSPLPSPAFPPSKTAMQATDEAIAAFDFGLDAPSARSVQMSQADVNKVVAPRAFRDFSVDKSLPSTPSKYSLFPKVEPARAEQPSPLIRLQALNKPPTAATPHSLDLTASHNISLPPAVRPRTDSSGSVHFPSAIITAQAPGKYPRRPLPLRTTGTTTTSSPPPTNHRGSISARWSGDTVTPSLDSPSGSKGTGRSSTSSSTTQSWPPTGSIWEDSDDEEVPLRRKVARKFSRASDSTVDTATRASATKQCSGSLGWFRRWVLCGACGGDDGQ